MLENRFQGVHEWIPERRGPCFTTSFRDRHPAAIEANMPQLVSKFWSQF
jgi:hypothetical protein